MPLSSRESIDLHDGTTGEEPEREGRETWTHRIDFLLACIGFSVGLGNVWRFPYLCYKNGGGAFLLPYLICVVVGGIPLFYLEVALGQFMAQGGVNAWRICPILQGIGWASTVIVFFLNTYYNVILAWAFYYLFASFSARLPWDGCGHAWNTANCSESAATRTNDTANGTANWVDPTTEYWERRVLDISDGIDDLGPIKWDLCLCLLLAWIIVCACIWNGIKTSGKVVYFTATAPYLFLTILLIRATLLPGAKQGILFYVVPKFHKLANIQVWVDAGTQIFFSYSISLGALTALGSYNRWRHNSYRDAIIFSVTNSGTSVFSGFLIFAVLGYMAEIQQTTVEEVAELGPGLAFIAYPKAVSTMPFVPQLWSFCFFFMIILLGLDSQFVGVEGFVTSCVDTFPVLRKGINRKLFLVGTCAMNFALGLVMVTRGGMYVFQLFDYYSGSRILLLVAFFECVAIAWIYGVNRFYDNIEMMLGFRINFYMKICWTVLSPIFCICIFLLSIVQYSELSYERPTGVYQYPTWAIAVGWALAGVSAICIPLVAIFNAVRFHISGKDLRELFRPQGLKAYQLRPQDTPDRNVVMTQYHNKGFS